MSEVVEKICAIIPAYNAEHTIVPVIQGVSKYLRQSQILVIDDGSEDKTVELAKSAGAIVLSHAKNSGKGAALKTGYQFALKNGFRAVICLDADLQHDPDEIPAFISMFQKTGADIVLGNRMGDLSRMPRDRWFSNKTTSLLISILTGVRVVDSQSGYRLIKTDILKTIHLRSNFYETESELLVKALRLKYRVAHVPIKTIYNSQPSHIHRLRDTARFIKIVVRSLIFWD